MKLTVGSVLFASIAVVAAATAGSAQSGMSKPRPAATQPHAAAPADATAIARGEYLANRVAMCVQCHSGRDQHGDLIEAEKFKGGAIPVLSPFPEKTFALRAPNLSGLVGFTDEQIVTLLTQGAATGRRAPRPPMPPFRLEKSDAEAVVAYLRTR